MPEPLSIITETTPLGDGLCVFRRDSHALCVLNGTAAEIWEALQLGLDTCAVALRLSKAYGIGFDAAHADVEAIISGWERSGLTGEPEARINKTVPELQGSKSDHSACAMPQQPAPVLDAVYGLRQADCGRKTEGRFRLPYPRIRIRCHEPILAGLLSAVLSPLEITHYSKSNSPECRLLEIGESSGGYWITLDGALIATGLERPQVRRLALQQFLVANYDAGQISAILHASSVEIEGRAVLIAGASGAGKTTLTAGLVDRGARYLADDLVPLFQDGGTVGCFGVALAIKQGSWPLVSDLFCALRREKIYETRSLRVRYLNLSKAAAQTGPMPSDSAPVAGLVLPHYAPEATLSVRRLTPEEAFAALIGSGSAPQGKQLSVRSLAQLANQVPAWQLTYGNLGDAVTKIFDLVAR